MSLPTFNSKSPTIKRILKEASELSKNPDPTLHAAPLETDLFEWHFTIRGPPSTPYELGAYHGRIVLPQQYPLRPPSFRFLTPSGRFEPNREICLSISGHHEETWQPAWGIRTALWALRAFMEGGAKGQVGGQDMPEAERKRLAEESRTWRCSSCGGMTNDEILKAQQAEGGSNSGEGVIPGELKFGYKDQLPNQNNDDNPSAVRSQRQTIGDVSQKMMHNRGPTSIDSSQSNPTASPLASASVSSHSSSLPGDLASSHQQSSQAAAAVGANPPVQRPSQDAVPGWVDKAIAGVLATLTIMIIKKFVL